MKPRETSTLTPALYGMLRGAAAIHLPMERGQSGTDAPSPMVRAGTEGGTRLRALGGEMPKWGL